MTAALLVVSYGSHELVEEGLTRTAVPDGALVVVVDNFTSAAEREVMRSLASRHGWILLEPDDNLGFGGGMNFAANEAIARGATSLILLNPDAYIEADGVAALTRSPSAPGGDRVATRRASRRQSLRVTHGDRPRYGNAPPRARRQPLHAVDLWVSGACVAMSTELWQRVSGFDQDYFLYWEDVDLSVRIAKTGGAVHVAEHVRAVHSPGGTQEQGGRPGKSPPTTSTTSATGWCSRRSTPSSPPSHGGVAPRCPPRTRSSCAAAVGSS